MNFHEEAERIYSLRVGTVSGISENNADGQIAEVQVQASTDDNESLVLMQGIHNGLIIDIMMSRIWVYERLHRRESPILSIEASNTTESTSAPAKLSFNAVFDLDGSSMGSPFQVEIPELKPHESIAIPAPRRRWIPSGEKFLAISEGSRAVAFTELSVSGTVQQFSTEITLLPADQWWAAGGELNLVAFIRPNDTEIGVLLREASDILLARTGQASLDGYQSSEQRVHEIAHAIYDAMQARDIAYVEPPQSFYTHVGVGQRVRSPQEVLVERRGTCLDLATTYAAALEQAGVFPYLIVTSNHAFAGYRTVESPRTAEILTDAGLISNALAMDGMELVETTSLCQRANPISFDEARGEGRQKAVAFRRDLKALIDVHSAHQWIAPLPTMRWEGDTRIIETVVSRTAAPEREFASTTESTRLSDDSPIRVGRWKRGLLDLTFRNPLLRMQKRSSSEILVSPKSLGKLEDLLDIGTNLTLHHQDRATELVGDMELLREENSTILSDQMTQNRVLFTTHTEKEYRRRLTALQRKAKEDLQESGADSLYLGIGTLEWEDGSRTGKAPLFLIPVRLLGGKGSTSFALAFDTTREFQPNFCLDEKLRTGYGIDLPELLNPGNDEQGLDIDGALKRIRRKLVDAEAKSFRVSESVFLANLKFATIDLWRDLKDNWPQFMERPVVRHLVENAGAPFNDGIEVPPPADADEAKLRLPIPADGSQIEAIRWADSGKTFVLEGPPGTGKSQTITNLIAHLLSQGKKVLFVAEKHAALDVVGRRLESVGLAPLTLNLHGKNQSPVNVRAQLQEAIDYVPGVVPGFDAAQITYESLAKRLALYPRLVHEEGPAGKSAWEAHNVALTSVPDEILEPTDVEIPRSVVLSNEQPQEALNAAWSLADALSNLSSRPQDSIWTLADAPSQGDNDLNAQGLMQALNDMFDLVDKLDAVPDLAEFLITADGEADRENLAAWAERSKQPATPKIVDAQSTVTDAWNGKVRALKEILERYNAAHHAIMQILTFEAARSNPESLQNDLAEATRKFFGRKKRRNEFASSLNQYLIQGQPPIDPDMLERFLDDWACGYKVLAEELLPAVHGIDGVAVPTNFEPLNPEHIGELFTQIENLTQVAALAESKSFSSNTDLWVAIGESRLQAGDIISLDQKYTALKAKLHTTTRSEEQWLEGRTWVEALHASRAAWLDDAKNLTFLALQRWLTLQCALAEFDALAMPGIRAQVLEEEINDANAVISVNFALALEVERERMESTGLSSFDSKKRDRQVTAFMESAQQIRAMLARVVPNEIIAERTIDVTSSVGQVGLLRQQLGRRRGGLSIRELMHRYGNTITQLSPCFLMSPASVSRFLPATGLEFDVVVFDEASQIRVPEAIGAMGRGKSVVVVGDSQQMPPSSMFAAAALDEEEEENSEGELLAPQDMESILSEAVESAIPRNMLTWHYRSKDESLIAFSNVHYYEEKLSSFPAPPAEESAHSAVEFRNVHGTWEGGSGRSAQRVNRAEAKAVVEEILRQLRLRPETSIGVVTFNKPQQELVLDLLDEAAVDNSVLEQALERETDEIFVKNLENVQGDERDTILFTLAFSKDENGKIPLNWGPLTRQGGEKRLNVAVTRAKERVIVFGSFEPQELDTSRSNSAGLKDLREYLMSAKNGVGHLAKTHENDRTAHASDIRTSLIADGLEVVSNVGLSDFTVDFAVRASAEHPWIAVLLDGPAWYGRLSVGDRDALPHSVLVEKMGWVDTFNVWLPEWMRDKDAVVTLIRQAAENATLRETEPPLSLEVVLGEPSVGKTEVFTGVEPAEFQDKTDPKISLDVWNGSEAPAEPKAESIQVQYRSAGVQETTEFTFTPVAQASENTELNVFVPASDSVRYDKSLLDDRTGKGLARLRGELLDVVNAESPVLLSRLAKIVASRYDLGRLLAARQKQILKELPRQHVRRSPNGDEVAWADVADAEEYSDYRLGNERTLQEIPYEELLSAMKVVVMRSGGMTEDEALRETARMFEIARMGRAVKERLQSVVDAALRRGDLKMTDGLLQNHQ
ncbi:DUF4011 domain-containing protein [Glutamicibacter sp.]|uniref:DUF4011 domain-containing protein n=1 Tax=Glutamicibacter sp. TaxID=1931995 RepID=UPI0028BE758E|nr:DUF4011 domain-containing protein [Glutamicibacter sp.]